MRWKNLTYPLNYEAIKGPFVQRGLRPEDGGGLLLALFYIVTCCITFSIPPSVLMHSHLPFTREAS